MQAHLSICKDFLQYFVSKYEFVSGEPANALFSPFLQNICKKNVIFLQKSFDKFKSINIVPYRR
jgi:hypothetical protein